VRTASEYLRSKPHARASTLASREKVAAKVDQLKRETAKKDMASRPRSETTVRKMMRGIAELMARIG
jgi:hypothetical protein